MGGEAFQAGSIFVELRAQAEQVQQGVQKAQAALSSLSAKATQVSHNLQSAGANINAMLGMPIKKVAEAAVVADEAINTRFIGRLGKFSAKMLHVQIGVMALSQAFGDNLGEKVKYAAAGLQAFAMTALMMPGPWGLVIGGVTGLATALMGLVGPTKAEKEALERLDGAIKKASDSYAALAADLTTISRDFESKKLIGQILQEDLAKFNVDEAIAKLQRIRDGVVSAERANDEAVKQLLEARKKLQAAEDARKAKPRYQGSWAPGAYAASYEGDTAVAAAQKEVDRLSAKVREASTIAAKAIAPQGDAVMAAKAALSAAVDMQAVNERIYVRQVEMWAEERQRAEEKKHAAFELGEAENAYVYEVITAEKAAADAKKKAVHELGEAELRYVYEVAQAEKDAIEEKKKAAREYADAENEYVYGVTQDAENARKQREDAFRKAYGDPMASAISDGLKRGILEGQSAMETLANIGNQLFANWVDDLAKNLQESLSNAITSVLGADGALGQVATGILGVVGMLFSKRSGKSSSVYGATSAVTSNEALRGIVAGPQSVAISAVGDNISRAMAPIAGRIDISNILLSRILSKIGGGGAGSGSLAYAGATPA